MALNDLQRACTGSTLAVGDPIRGWREWGLTPDGLRGSLGRYWRPGVNEAECHGRQAPMLRVLDEMFGEAGLTAPRHIVEPWCSCGLYSWKLPDPVGGRPDKVVGVIEMWGRVLVGERGFRAQYARVVAMAGPRAGRVGRPRGHHPTHRDRATVAARYAVPYFATMDEAVAYVQTGGENP